MIFPKSIELSIISCCPRTLMEHSSDKILLIFNMTLVINF